MQTVRHFIIVLLASQLCLSGSLCRMWCCNAERVPAVAPVAPPTSAHSHCHAADPALPQHQADQTQVKPAYYHQTSTVLLCPCVYQPMERPLTARARQSFASGHSDESLSNAGAILHWAPPYERRGVAVPRFQPHSPPRAQLLRNLRI